MAGSVNIDPVKSMRQSSQHHVLKNIVFCVILNLKIQLSHRDSFMLHRIVKLWIYQPACSICVLSVPCLPSMPPKSALWKYFCTNKTWYKGDKTHNNTWCKGCIISYVNEQTQADTLVLTEPSPSPPFWSVSELENEGQCRVANF